MNPAAAIFVIVSALLGDMHAVAIKGQASSLSRDEGLSLAFHLRSEAAKLDRSIAAIESRLR